MPVTHGVRGSSPLRTADEGTEEIRSSTQKNEMVSATVSFSFVYTLSHVLTNNPEALT